MARFPPRGRAAGETATPPRLPLEHSLHLPHLGLLIGARGVHTPPINCPAPADLIGPSTPSTPCIVQSRAHGLSNTQQGPDTGQSRASGGCVTRWSPSSNDSRHRRVGSRWARGGLVGLAWSREEWPMCAARGCACASLKAHRRVCGGPIKLVPRCRCCSAPEGNLRG